MNYMNTPENSSAPIECQQVLALFIADAANEHLTEQEYAAMAEHLEYCQPCLEIVEHQQANWSNELDETLRKANEANCVPAQVATRPRASTGVLRVAGWSLAVTAAIFLLLFLRDLPAVPGDRTATTDAGRKGTLQSPDKSISLPVEIAKEQRQTPEISLRAHSGFVVAQRDESTEIPFYWVLPTNTRIEQH